MEEFNHKHYNYKWTKGFLIAIFLTFILISGAAFGQVVTSGSSNTPSGYSIDGTTGNLIPYDSSLKTDTGTWTSSSGSSGGWVPYGSPQGSFNALDGYTFSYVGEELGIAGISLNTFPHGYQNTNAVFVTGFMYGLKYRFPCANSIGGSCTDTNGPQDTLRVEVGYYPASGAASFYIHQLGLKNQTDGFSAYNPNWQTLAETVTFAGAKTLAQAGSVNIGIYGQDAGFWACIMPDCYGPQVKDAYIRANYSVDPCILNPAFSPNCPGFQNILQGSKSPAFYYSYNIAQSLPHIGGGVILHGYDYGFTWYNYGACYNTFMFWCTDWRTDGGGGINFRISDKNNNTMFYDRWYVEGNNSGGGFSSRYLFTESQNSLNMGNIQWWTDSVWNHFGWTGWTRPVWTPDPCYEQPLYSPNCSNFDAEIKRLAAEQKTIQDAQLATTVASITTTPSSTITTTVTNADTTNPTVTVTTTETEPVKTTAVATAPNTTQPTITSNSTIDTTPTTSNTTRTSTPRMELNNSTDMALNLIRQNQQRDISISSQASQNALQTASSAASAGIRQAENIALEAANKSQNLEQQKEQQATSEILVSSKVDNLLNLGPAPGSTSVVNIGIQQRYSSGQTNIDIITNQTSSTSTSAIVPFNAMSVSVTPAPVLNVILSPSSPVSSPPTISTYSPPVQASSEYKINDVVQTQDQQAISNNTILVLQPQQPVYNEPNQTTISTLNQLPIASIDLPTPTSNFTTDRTNPINSIIESKTQQVEQENKNTNITQVKSNVQDNDAAVGVSIANIARTPVGFNSYMVALSDANFYTPKEIYRNQKTVDNVRALRQLASDRLHQQMVDQQYLPR